jgi:hypothetical protein
VPVVISLKSAFVRLATPTSPVSSHVAQNVVSPILMKIGWDLKTRLNINIQLDTAMMLPHQSGYLLQNQGLTRLPFRAKNLNIHHIRTWVIDIFQIAFKNKV